MDLHLKVGHGPLSDFEVILEPVAPIQVQIIITSPCLTFLYFVLFVFC